MSSSGKGGGKYTGSAPSKGNVCFVQHCRSKWLQKLSVRLSFFKLPRAVDETSLQIHQKWKENLGIIKRQNDAWIKICELHFQPHCFQRDLEAELTGRPLRKRLKPGSLPSLFLTQEENAVADLNGESVEDIQNCQTLMSLAKNLRQYKPETGNLKHCAPSLASNSSEKKLTKPFLLPKESNSNQKPTALKLLFTSPEESVEPSSDIQQLSKHVQNLQAKLSVQSQALKDLKRKYAKRESVIKKLRSELSALRKERRKLKQREYMRKSKQIKTAQKRKEKRAWICKQIEAGNAQVIQQFQLSTT